MSLPQTDTNLGLVTLQGLLFRVFVDQREQIVMLD